MDVTRSVLLSCAFFLCSVGQGQVLPFAFYRGNAVTAPTYMGSSSVTSGNTTTSTTVTKPAGVQLGDLLVVWQARGSTGTASGPAGWTKWTAINSGGYGQNLFTKIATATEVAASGFAFTWSGSADTSDRHSIIVYYRGVNQTAPVVAVNPNSGTGSTATYLGGTTAKPKSVLLTICTAGGMSGVPSGFTSRNADGWATRASDRIIIPQGPTGNFTGTTSSPWGSYLIIISPP